MKKHYNTPAISVSAFSPKETIAALGDFGISTPEEEITDEEEETPYNQ